MESHTGSLPILHGFWRTFSIICNVDVDSNKIPFTTRLTALNKTSIHMFICIGDGKQQYVWPNFTQLSFYISPFNICLCFKKIGCIQLITRLTHFNLTVFWQLFIHHKLFIVLTIFLGAEQKSKVPVPTLMQDRVCHMCVGVYIAAGVDWGRGQECDLAQKQKTPESYITTKKFGVRQSPSESRKEHKHHSWAVIDLAPGCLSFIRSVKSPSQMRQMCSGNMLLQDTWKKMCSSTN